MHAFRIGSAFLLVTFSPLLAQTPEEQIERVITAACDEDSKAIIELIKNPKAPVEKRLRALIGLRRGKGTDAEVVAVLNAILKDPEASIRAAAVGEIGFLGSTAKATIPTLLEMLGDEEMERAGVDKGGPEPLIVAALGSMGPAAVKGLIDVVKDETNKGIVRWRALQVLSRLGRQANSALPILEATMTDQTYLISIESACAYVRAGGDFANALPVLRSTLKDNRPAIVWNSARAIERIGPRAKETIKDLIPLLKHQDTQIRIKAAQALSQMGLDAKPAVAAMTELLKEKNGRQGYLVARALENLGPNAREALPVLLERLKDLEEVRPNPILTILGNLGTDAKPAVPALVDLLKEKKPRFSGDVLLTLGRIGPAAEAAVPHLVAFLEKPSEYDRARAARALGQIGPKAESAAPPLKKLLEDERAMVRIWAAFALARITGDSKPHVAVILELRKAESGKGREKSLMGHDAAEALALLGSEARPARDALLEALLDRNTPAGTHGHVARALGHLHDDADVIVPKLIALLEQPGEGFRQKDNCEHAVEALGMFGPKAKAAISQLRRLVKEEDHGIAEAAARVLEKMESR